MVVTSMIKFLGNENIARMLADISATQFLFLLFRWLKPEN